jgi:L-asparaginase/Glu-tRNA(Gln) amidotransferase subunit D
MPAIVKRSIKTILKYPDIDYDYCSQEVFCSPIMAIIAVAGGLGQVGRALVDGLVQHGHKVLVLTRKVSDQIVAGLMSLD